MARVVYDVAHVPCDVARVPYDVARVCLCTHTGRLDMQDWIGKTTFALFVCKSLAYLGVEVYLGEGVMCVLDTVCEGSHVTWRWRDVAVV